MGHVTSTTHVSDWTCIDSDRIRAYAELTEDHNPIHLDEAFAASTPLGRTIAHGTVSLAVLMRGLRRVLTAEVVSAGSVEVRFRAPVFVGMRVRARVDAADGRGAIPVSVEREDGVVVISGCFLSEPGT